MPGIFHHTISSHSWRWGGETTESEIVAKGRILYYEKSILGCSEFSVSTRKPTSDTNKYIVRSVVTLRGEGRDAVKTEASQCGSEDAGPPPPPAPLPPSFSPWFWHVLLPSLRVRTRWPTLWIPWTPAYKDTPLILAEWNQHSAPLSESPPHPQELEIGIVFWNTLTYKC